MWVAQRYRPVEIRSHQTRVLRDSCEVKAITDWRHSIDSKRRIDIAQGTGMRPTTSKFTLLFSFKHRFSGIFSRNRQFRAVGFGSKNEMLHEVVELDLKCVRLKEEVYQFSHKFRSLVIFLFAIRNFVEKYFDPDIRFQKQHKKCFPFLLSFQAVKKKKLVLYILDF